MAEEENFEEELTQEFTLTEEKLFPTRWLVIPAAVLIVLGYFLMMPNGTNSVSREFSGTFELSPGEIIRTGLVAKKHERVRFTQEGVARCFWVLESSEQKKWVCGREKMFSIEWDTPIVIKGGKSKVKVHVEILP